MKEADSKGYILYDPIYMTFWKYYMDRKLISGCQGLGGQREVKCKGAQGNFGG